MAEIQEFRIGNLIMVNTPNDNLIYKVIGIDLINYQIRLNGGRLMEWIPEKEVKPILMPTADSLLSKLNFFKIPLEKSLGYHGRHDLNFGLPVLNINDYEWLATNGCGKYIFLNGLRINCAYIHQLQNLYFALTSKELEITNDFIEQLEIIFSLTK